MILVDFSSTMHRCLFTQVKDVKPTLLPTGKFRTEDFQDYWKCLVLEELFKIQQEYQPYLNTKNNQGMVLCLDYHNKQYWRKNFYPEYKEQRNKVRQESDINFKEFFEVSNGLIELLKNNTPWKVFETEGQEADDLILVLCREFQDKEPILIHSPDKDFIQCQRYSPLIKQYSALTHKFITPDTKSGTMQEWIYEHICLGDDSDNVPKIVQDTEFTKEFIEYMKEKDQEYIVYDWLKLPQEDKDEFLEDFELGSEGVFKKMRFGPVALKKTLEKYGSINEWLKTNKVLEENFYRNYTLVMEEGIPTYLREQILKDFVDQNTEFGQDEFENYLKENRLNSLIPLLPSEFRTEITIDFFEW